MNFSSVQKHTRPRDIFSLFCVPLLSPGPESIKWFIEDLPFSSSYNPPPYLCPNPSSFSKLNRRHTGRRRKRDKLLTEEREGRVGGGAKSYNGEEAWSYKNHSTLSVKDCLNHTVSWAVRVSCTRYIVFIFPFFRSQFFLTSPPPASILQILQNFSTRLYLFFLLPSPFSLLIRYFSLLLKSFTLPHFMVHFLLLSPFPFFVRPSFFLFLLRSPLSLFPSLMSILRIFFSLLRWPFSIIHFLFSLLSSLCSRLPTPPSLLLSSLSGLQSAFSHLPTPVSLLSFAFSIFPSPSFTSYSLFFSSIQSLLSLLQTSLLLFPFSLLLPSVYFYSFFNVEQRLKLKVRQNISPDLS
jgi:hypothetical protein